MLKTVQALFLAALLAFTGLAGAQVSRVQGAITTQNLVSAGNCTTGGCVEIDISNKGTLSAHVTGTYTGALSGQITTDGVTWVTMGGSGSFTNLASGSTSATISSGSTGIFRVAGATGTLKFRLAGLSSMTGTATITLQSGPVPPESSTTISGGAGDASAANQATGNASLASIDGKLPSLSSGRVPVTDLSVVAQGSTTSGQSGSLVQCSVTTAAPTYTTGQTSPLNCDTSGGLRISGGGGGGGGAVTVADGADVTQGANADAAATQGGTGTISAKLRHISANTPTLGTQAISASRSVTPATSSTWAATQSGTWSMRLQDGSGNAITSATRGSERPLSVQILDGSGNQVTAFSGSGGTASNFGSTVPSAGTAAGFSDGTNMQLGRVFDADSGAGTQYVQGVSLRVSASGGSAEAAAGSGATNASTLRVVSATDDPIISAINGTNSQLPSALGTQAISGSLSVTPATSSSWPVSGTVSITANSAVNVAQINGVTPLMGAGNTGTGSHRVTIATDQAALPAHGLGAVNAAAPTGAQMNGVRSGANMVAMSQGSATVAIDTSSAATAQLVALSSGQVIHVTSVSVMAAGTGTIRFVYGTGTNCGTGTTNLTGAYPLIANAGLTIGGGLGPVFVVPAGNALCMTTSAAIDYDGHVTYTQYTP